MANSPRELDREQFNLIVQMHRDPVKSVSSYASLCAAFRGIYTRSIDLKELGAQVMNRLAVDFESYMAQRQGCDASKFLDMQYSDLVRDPLATVRRIYQRFNLMFSPAAEQRMRAFLARGKVNKSRHRYSPQDFVLTPQLIRERFQTYIDAFDIPDER